MITNTETIESLEAVKALIMSDKRQTALDEIDILIEKIEDKNLDITGEKRPK